MLQTTPWGIYPIEYWSPRRSKPTTRWYWSWGVRRLAGISCCEYWHVCGLDIWDMARWWPWCFRVDSRRWSSAEEWAGYSRFIQICSMLSITGCLRGWPWLSWRTPTNEAAIPHTCALSIVHKVIESGCRPHDSCPFDSTPCRSSGLVQHSAHDLWVGDNWPAA